MYEGLPSANDGGSCQSLMASTIEHVAETGSKYEPMDRELRSSIIGTLTRFLSLFRSDDVARATVRTTFSLNALRAKPSTLYLVVREGDQASLIRFSGSFSPGFSLTRPIAYPHRASKRSWR